MKKMMTYKRLKIDVEKVAPHEWEASIRVDGKKVTRTGQSDYDAYARLVAALQVNYGVA